MADIDMDAVKKVQDILKKFVPLEKWKGKNLVDGESFVLLHQASRFTLIGKSSDCVRHLDGCIGGYNAYVYETVSLLNSAKRISEEEEIAFLAWLDDEDRKLKRDDTVQEITRLAFKLGYKLVKVG